MTQPQLWNRRCEWPEWRQKHIHLNDKDAQMLFENELRMFNMYEQDLINLREQRIDNYFQDLSSVESIIQYSLDFGGHPPFGFKGNSTDTIQTYSTPGTYTITRPEVPEGFFPYDHVTVEVVGGGAHGQIGYVYDQAQDGLYEGWAMGGGGGGGAYAKKAHALPTEDVVFELDTRQIARQEPTISITVGSGGQESGSAGTNSSATVNGVTTEAGGGKTYTLTDFGDGSGLIASIANAQDITALDPPLTSKGSPNNIFYRISAGGQPSGDYDTGTAGSNGNFGDGVVVGGGQFSGKIFKGVSGNRSAGRGRWEDTGIGGASGYPGATTASAATVRIEPSSHPTDPLSASMPNHAQNGFFPGGGGGGGFVDRVGSLGDMGPGKGADGQVIVTFGYRFNAGVGT